METQKLAESMKDDLIQLIISEKGEGEYYKIIAERVKSLYEFKKTGDVIFGADDELFRKSVIEMTLVKNRGLSDEKQLYDLTMTEIALDVFIQSQ